jgi:hypothetical protein
MPSLDQSIFAPTVDPAELAAIKAHLKLESLHRINPYRSAKDLSLAFFRDYHPSVSRLEPGYLDQPQQLSAALRYHDRIEAALKDPTRISTPTAAVTPTVDGIAETAVKDTKKFPWGKLGIGAGIAAGTAGLAYGGKKLYDHYKQSSEMPPSLEEALQLHDADRQRCLSAAPEHLHPEIHQLFDMERGEIENHYGATKQANTPTPTEAALFLKDAIKKLTLFHPEKLTSPRDLDSLGAHVRSYVESLPPEVKAQINHLHGDFEAGHATAHDILKGNIPAPPIKAAPPQPQQPQQHNGPSNASGASESTPSKSKWPLYTALGVGGAGLLGGAGAVGHHLYKEREREHAQEWQ